MSFLKYLVIGILKRILSFKYEEVLKMMNMTNQVKKELEQIEEVLNCEKTYDVNKLQVIESIIYKLLHE
jgi:hypothetical protein